MTEDLSAYHYPLTALFALPSEAEALASHSLSDEQIAFYREHGYLSGIRVLTDEQIEMLRQEMIELLDPAHAGNSLFYEFHTNESADPTKTLFHALGAWRIAKGFHDLLWNSAVTMPAAQLLGGGVRFWHDQIFYKPAGHGGGVAWHQDYSYWTRTRPIAHLTCWIGLDDSTRDNGCVQYVPGSHRWDLLPITGLAGDMQAIESVLTAEQRTAFAPVAIEMKAGDASFHHPLMVHGSYENKTDKPRRAVVINLFRDGVQSASDDPPLAGVPAIRAGEKMQGQFFPLLYEPKPGR